jgi:hypothetical protein
MTSLYCPTIGRTIAEVVILSRGDYAETYLADQSDPARQRAFLRLRSLFDHKAFIVTCTQKGCSKKAVRVAINDSTPVLTYWCATCRPQNADAGRQGYAFASTFVEVMKIINHRYKRGAAIKRRIIREMAVAKGAGPTITHWRARDFFR